MSLGDKVTPGSVWCELETKLATQYEGYKEHTNSEEIKESRKGCKGHKKNGSRKMGSGL